MKKRVYSTEFKTNAVSLSYQRDNIKDLADELDLDVQRIYKWRKDPKLNNKLPLSEQKSSSLINSVSLKEYKFIEKQLKEKELELEILKKAIHIFSKKDGSIINS